MIVGQHECVRTVGSPGLAHESQAPVVQTHAFGVIVGNLVLNFVGVVQVTPINPCSDAACVVDGDVQV